VVKNIASSDVEENVFVVIAATYDLSTPESPACFNGLEHIDPNVTEEEAVVLFNMHAEVWDYGNWKAFRETIVDLSKFVESETYHIGVIMAGMRMLANIRKPTQGLTFTEEMALAALRSSSFTESLDRCFCLRKNVPIDFKERLLDVVIRDSEDGTYVEVDDLSLAPFIRAGLLTKRGKFSNVAATWYYNRRCFPKRATHAPETLDGLITGAVRLISAKRLIDTLKQGFPKEATFQHLFNEAM
jgi:hypothetical protein